MGKILVLAEKPSVGRELARVLDCKQKGDGCLIGKNYIVTWALGHLVTLCDPEAYGEEYKEWRLDTLPMLPKKMELTVIPQTSKQYRAVKRLLHQKDVRSLVIATDAGREGELVARWILEKAGFHKPIQRLWISSQTDRAIRQGFANLKDGKAYDALYASAQARAEADWLVGFNISRALTCKFNAQLSAGRVQTPTLALLTKREQEIRKFVPKTYWTIRAELGKMNVLWTGKNGTSIFDREMAENILKKVQGKPFLVTEVKSVEKRTPPPLLYDLTELQRDANRLFGYSPKQTLNIMQRLYEQHKVLTYPRTDSRYLTEDLLSTMEERLQAVNMGAYAPFVWEIRAKNRKIAKACVNQQKVHDHHAIIPTEERANMLALSTEEKKIYDLVVRRFLTCFYPVHQYRHIKAAFACENETFTASGREVTVKGWKEVYDLADEEIDENEQNMPPLQKGMSFSCRAVYKKEGQTSPPARYTEATLLSAMENPAKFIQDQKMREYIGGGLGTPATRADIIEKLYASFYVEKQGNSMIPTAKGMQLVELVPEDLKEPLLTAQWEMRLDAIANGKEAKTQFIQEIRSYASALVDKVKNSQKMYKHENMTKKVCPSCGKFLLEVNGKRGKMLVCQDRECGYRKNLSRKTNVRCPNCHKQMELIGEGENRKYVCACGYREKEEAFRRRMRDSGKGASKREVQQYLRQQKQEDTNDLFAAAFEKAMQEKKKR